MTIIRSSQLDSLIDSKPHFNIKVLNKNLLSWFKKNKKSYLWRELWSKHKDPYFVWLSEVMLQQTTIKAVTPIYEGFVKKYPNLESLAKASEDDIKKSVQGLGYYRRFSNLHKACILLLKKNRKVIYPTDYKSWTKLPGVGDYTARAILSITKNAPLAVSDGNVERVLARVFDIRLSISDLKFKNSMKKLSQNILSCQETGDYNQAIMELGQQICLKEKPLCSLCPAKRICKANKNQSILLAPKAALKQEKENIQLSLFIMKKKKPICSNRKN